MSTVEPSRGQTTSSAPKVALENAVDRVRGALLALLRAVGLVLEREVALVGRDRVEVALEQLQAAGDVEADHAQVAQPLGAAQLVSAPSYSCAWTDPRRVQVALDLLARDLVVVGRGDGRRARGGAGWRRCLGRT